MLSFDINKNWTSIYHLTLRFFYMFFLYVFLFIFLVISLFFGATGIDWTKFECISKSLNGLFVWYYNYWSYLNVEDVLNKRFLIFDYIFNLVIYLFLWVQLYVYYPIKKVFITNYTLNILRYLFFGYIYFLVNLIYVILLDIYLCMYSLIFDEIYYNFLIARAFFIFSNGLHSGGSKYQSIIRFKKFLFKGLTIGAYGVHFEKVYEKSLLGRLFWKIKRGPYLWRIEEGKLSWERLDYFLNVFFLRCLVIFYFFLPGGEDYRRRSVLWQLLISDLAEDRYMDYSLSPGLRFNIPTYLFIYSNFFSIDVLEYTEIIFIKQQENLIYFLWKRKKYFEKVKENIILVFNFVIKNIYIIFIYFLEIFYYLFLVVYLIIYYLRSFFVILVGSLFLFLLLLLDSVVKVSRYVFVLYLNILLFVYRQSQVFAKLLIVLFELVTGLTLLILVFLVFLVPMYIYIIQMLWGMGGIFLAYFYVIWIPLLVLAGIFDEWKLVLHELGEWLFIICFNMGGWSAVFLRIDLDPRYSILNLYEPTIYINGSMSQEYQGFYMVYAGWAMDLIYVIFLG